MTTFDYVVIGAGAAGCVLAHRLCRAGIGRVLLLESGGSGARRESAVPAAWPKLFRSDLDWQYGTESNPGMDDRELFVPRGRALGGSTRINAMVCTRGNPIDYDEWAKQGSSGWSYADVLPYFKKGEHFARGPDSWRGVGGPQAVSDLRDPHRWSRAFVRAAEESGIRPNPDSNGATQEGVGLAQVYQRRGRRQSAADAYLHPVRKHPNLEVRTGAHAARVLLEGGRAVGVELLGTDGSRERIGAACELILCAGALNTPQLLMLSGIGPARELRALGIELAHELPGVGRNLQEHPAGKLVYRAREPESLLAAESASSRLRYLLLRRGPLTSNGAEALAFVRTRPELEVPDAELLFLPVVWTREGLEPPKVHGFTIAAMLLRPASRGVVTLRSSDPRDAPEIHTCHFSDPGGHDLETLVAALRVARTVALAPTLQAHHDGELFPGPRVSSDEALAARIRSDGQTLYHPVGTCRMGDDALAVVDPELRLRGIRGLRVIDASVMPTIPRGHVQAPTMMIAEKGADLVIEARRARD